MNNLESLATEIGKDIKDIRTRFATKEEMHETTEIDYSQIVTHEQLENKHYLTQHQELTHLATTSDLEALRNISVNKAELSKKVDTTEYNTFKDIVVTKDELAGKNYLTETAGDEKYALKSEAYNDSALVSRVQALENRPTVDTSHSDLSGKVDATEYNSFKESTVHTVDVIRNRLSNAEKALFARPSNPTLSLNDNTLSISGGNSVTLPTHQSEIRGTGMPNGVVEAPIGTTYIDTAKTKGALKWIKTTDGGNQGWRVIHGDTGWVLGWQNDAGDNKNRMYFRRKNDVVHVKFDPEINTSNITEGTNLILNDEAYKLNADLSIQGFRPVDDVVQTIFKTSTTIYGSTFNAADSEDAQGTGAAIIQYNYKFIDGRHQKDNLMLQIATSALGVKENHVNPFSYLTEDEWPTTLP